MKLPNHFARTPCAVWVTSLLIALTIAAPAHAQWKWRDASGRLQHSDLPPPPQVAEKDILQRPGASAAAKASAPIAATPASPARGAAMNPAAAASAAPAAGPKPAKASTKTALDTDVEQRRRAEAQDRLARKKADDERLAGQREDNCVRAREAVATLSSGQRVARVNTKGEREFLSDTQRAEETRRAQAVVTENCR